MKIITTRQDILLEFQTDSNVVIRMKMPRNRSFIMSDGVVKSTLDLYGSGCLKVDNDFTDLPNRYNGNDLTNKSLISIREGGAGDLLFKTPIFKYLKEKYPSCKIGLSCSPVYHNLFHQNPYINEIFFHVLPLEFFNRFDYFSTFEGLIEGSKEAEWINAYDLFIEKYGIHPSEIKEKIPILNIPAMVKDYWNCVLEYELKDSKPKIGFQWRASSPVRTLPFSLSADIIRKITEKGYKVFLLDSMSRKNDVARFIADNNLKDVVDTSKYSDNFERMAGIISLMDLFIGPDSSGTHIAAAFGKPIVGLYGPFRSELRLKYYKNAVGIDVIAEKCGRGCFMHAYTLCDFAKELGEKAGPCWRLLDSTVVSNEVDKLYKKVYGTKFKGG